MRVILVDDSAIVRERLAAMLAQLPSGVEVVAQARDPVEASAEIKRLNPDVVILDIRMPGGSGIDLLRKIKRERSEVTVIMLTNYPYPQYRKECASAGANFFLDKSIEFDQIPVIFRQLTEGCPIR